MEEVANNLSNSNRMGDFSSLGQQSQNFSQSTAFAAALQRAKQVGFFNYACQSDASVPLITVDSRIWAWIVAFVHL